MEEKQGESRDRETIFLLTVFSRKNKVYLCSSHVNKEKIRLVVSSFEWHLVLYFLEARRKKTIFFEPETLSDLTPLWPYVGGATSYFKLPCSSDRAAPSWHFPTQPEVLRVQHCWLLVPSTVWRENISQSFKWHYTKVILASELHFCYPSSLVKTSRKLSPCSTSRAPTPNSALDTSVKKFSWLYQQWCFQHKMVNINAVLITLQIMPQGWRSNEIVISETISDEVFSLLPRPLQKITSQSLQKFMI